MENRAGTIICEKCHSEDVEKNEILNCKMRSIKVKCKCGQETEVIPIQKFTHN